MKFLRSTLGYCIAGMLVMSVWDGFVIPYGIAGGFFAAIIIIGPMWYLNHYKGLIYDAPGSGFVDMGLGIGIAGIARDFFVNNMDFGLLVDTIPTLGLVILGAIIGGVIAAAIEKDFALDKEQVEKNKEGSEKA